MISFIKRFFYFSFFLICLALILFHFFPQYISKDRPLNFLDDYVVENFNLKIKYDQIKLSLSRGIKLENFRLYDNPLTEPNLIFQSENIYLILRFNWKEFSIKPALYLNGINLKNLISTQNDKSPNRYSIPPNLRNFPISLKKILNSKRIQPLKNIAIVWKNVYYKINKDRFITSGFIENLNRMKIFIADGKSQLKIRGEINNDQLQAIIKTKFSDSKFDIKGNIPISWRNEKINWEKGIIEITTELSPDKFILQSQGRLQLYNDNIPFKINLSSQKGIYSDVKAQLSGKYFIKSQKLSAELNSTIDNLKYDKYRVKKSSVKATYSSAKKTKLNLKAQQVLLDLDFLNHPLFAPTVKLRYKDGNLKADKINIKTGEQEYQLSLSSDELTKHFRLELQGEYFNFNSFSIGNSQKKSHKKTKLPIMDINIQCKKVVLSNLIIDDYLGNIQINDQIIYMKNNQGKLWNSKIGFSGEYQLKDNNLSGEYEVNKIDSKTFKRFFGDGFRLDGDILLRGDLQLVNSKYAMTGKFTNKKTVILDQSQLKNSVWNLPFISSQKTKIDTIRNIEGNFSLLFSKDKKEFILASTKANMGEHFVDVSGNINFTTSPTDYDFDIHYYFTEYFKDNYIIISQFFEAIKKINKWSPAEKNHHDQYDNLIKISIKKKAGKRSLKLFDQAKN